MPAERHLRERYLRREASRNPRPPAPYCPRCLSDNVVVEEDDNHEVLICGDCDYDEVIS